MKWFVIVLLLASSATFWQKTTATVEEGQPPVALVSPAASRSPVANPAYIEIPRLQVKADVEEVGMETDGSMGVPGSFTTLGWWKLGVRPGEKGNAVVAGHYDTPTGEPGVLYRLSELQPEDTVIVTDDEGNRYEYRVVKVSEYSDDNFPLEDVFGPIDGYYLNIITCAGSWDETTRNYSHRTVAYTRMLYSP